MSQTYVTILFADAAHAADAKRALESLAGVHVRRGFLIVRDAAGYHVDGRFAGELPTINCHAVGVLRTVLARMTLGSSREEDGVAVEDAQEELAVGQAAVVALVTEHDPTAIDRAMSEFRGSVTRRAVSTLDSEDTQRFLDATRIDPPAS